MCIFNFKTKSFNIKRERGFTFVEVMLVMVLISFLYIVTMKVIQHNLDQKVPVYVYNLYKNLDNESKLLTKKLIDDVANGSNTALKEKINTLNSTDSKMNAILETMNAKTYAKILANDFNTVGKIDNAGVSEVTSLIEAYADIFISNKNTMSRDFSFKVNKDGTQNIRYTPKRDIEKMQSNTYECFLNSEQKRTLKHNTQCMGTPNSTKYLDLFITPQVENQWYDVKVENIVSANNHLNFTATLYGDESVKNPDIEITTSNTITNVPEALKIYKKQDFSLIKYPIQKQKAVFSTNNNIKFHILATKTKPEKGNVKVKRLYYYNLTGYQDRICPASANIKSKMDIETIAEGWAESIGGWDKLKKNGSSLMVGDDDEWKNPHYYVYSNGTTYYKGMRVDQLKEQLKYLFFDRTNSNQNSCQGRINFVNGSKKISEGTILIPDDLNLYTYEPPRKVGEVSMAYFKNYYNNTADIRNYEKWNKFFEITGVTPRALDTLQYNSVSEGYNSHYFTFTYPKQFTNSTNKYPNHFIYVAIETSFNKGEMGKNIFVFEQFGSKIIPVGYLANNQNTPLKFDVITRNPETFKIEKVNYKDDMEKRPLTFCEAMKYTGDKFSEYCDCKDARNKIVTQYPKMASCDNKFGCIITPVKASKK